MSFRRILMWAEFVVAGAFAGLALYVVSVGVRYGHLNPDHGPALLYVVAFFLLIGAAAFALGGLGLRGTKPSGWLAQLFPIAAVAWVFWD